MDYDPKATVAIAGGGQAAVEMAFTLRKEGHGGRVVIVSEESHPPYQRPPLSKGFLTGKSTEDDLYFRPTSTYQEAEIELVLSTRVQAVDRPGQRLVLESGDALTYDLAGLALGGRARRLPVLHDAGNPSNVHYVRSILDVDHLRKQTSSGRRVAVVGGGYIGLETASVLVGLGAHVTVIEAQPRVLARVTTPHMSEFYESVHRAHGVRVITGASVVAADIDEESGEVTGISLDSGECIGTDVVVVGVGLVPNTDIASAAGLVVDGGIVVDEKCRTSDERIFAAGDCTRHPSPLHGGQLVRVESVSNAVEQGRVAARSMMGRSACHDAVPWFWSDQYDMKLHMVGRSTNHDEIVIRGNLEEGSSTTFYLEDGRLVGADVVNRTADFAWARRLVSRRAMASAQSLADPAIPLKSLLATTEEM